MLIARVNQLTNRSPRTFVTATVANSAGPATSTQQVIQLTAANFDFSRPLSTGADIRIKSADGLTDIPFWRRTWDVTKRIGEIWFKAPTLATGANTFRITWGGPTDDASSYSNTMQKLAVDANTLALFHFDEGTGKPVDSAGLVSAASITLDNAPTWVAADLGGWAELPTQNFSTGASMSFNGTNQLAKFAGLMDTYSTQFCVSIIFQWLSAPPAADRRIWCKYNDLTGGSEDLIELYWDGGIAPNSMWARLVINGVTVFLKSSTRDPVWVVNTPYHFVIQGGTGGFEMWMNGHLEARSAATTGVPSNGTTAPFTVGGYYDGTTTTQWANIQVDELHALSRKLTRNEIVCNLQRRKYFAGESRINNRLTRNPTNPILSVTAAAWDSQYVQEPAVYHNGSQYEILYTGYDGVGGITGLGLATCATVAGTYVKAAGSPLIGKGGLGGAVVACHAGLYVEGGTYYAIYSDSTGNGANLKYAKATAAAGPWTDGGIFLASNAQAWSVSWANPFIYKEGATYHLMVEGRASVLPNALWRVGHATGPSPVGPWTFGATNPLTTLQVGVGSWSHAEIKKVGSVYHMLYHVSATGTLPSLLWHAISADLDNWLPDTAGWVVADMNYDTQIFGSHRVDQIADPNWLEVGGQTQIFYDISTNYVTLNADINVATFAGPASSFVVDVPSVAVT